MKVELDRRHDAEYLLSSAARREIVEEMLAEVRLVDELDPTVRMERPRLLDRPIETRLVGRLGEAPNDQEDALASEPQNSTAGFALASAPSASSGNRKERANRTASPARADSTRRVRWSARSTRPSSASTSSARSALENGVSSMAASSAVRTPVGRWDPASRERRASSEATRRATVTRSRCPRDMPTASRPACWCAARIPWCNRRPLPLVGGDVDVDAACPDGFEDQPHVHGPAEVDELVLLERAAVRGDGRISGGEAAVPRLLQLPLPDSRARKGGTPN